MSDDDPTARRRRLVRSLMRRRGADDRLTVRAGDPADERTLRYGDRVLELALRAGERDRLDALLDDYHVFKIKQPDTRKAAGGEVYVSAVADPKHLADFIEACCRRVFGLPDDYPLRIE